jgi:hypothetical protein
MQAWFIHSIKNMSKYNRCYEISKFVGDAKD